MIIAPTAIRTKVERHPKRLPTQAPMSTPVNSATVSPAVTTERQWGEPDAPVAKSTLGHRLKVLRSSGVTRTREEGTRCYVHLRAEELEQRFPGLLESLLAVSGHGATTVGIKQPRQPA
ncbi:winged helix-turn-helix domain-containing protein [Streptomyces sp. NPDC087218]|uniref:helix-turn-helix domain-containing protein n=1 Tax=Streptomyces sp. NPDC087218 TaxID=3365769 RepID=UPI00381F13D5